MCSSININYWLLVCGDGVQTTWWLIKNWQRESMYNCNNWLNIFDFSFITWNERTKINWSSILNKFGYMHLISYVCETCFIWFLFHLLFRFSSSSFESQILKKKKKHFTIVCLYIKWIEMIFLDFHLIFQTTIHLFQQYGRCLSLSFIRSVTSKRTYIHNIV